MTRFAYVLGANGPESFGRLKRLSWAEADADNMAARLGLDDLGFKVTARESTVPKATDVIEQFQNVAFEAGAQDELLFYFAGHGVVSRGELYFILNETVRGKLVGTGLPWDTVKKIVLHSDAAAKVVVLDCCHAGEAIDDPLGGAFRGGFDTEVIDSAVKGSSASILVACGPDGFARESAKMAGGVLTGLILQALGPRRTEVADASGRVSLEGLRNWIWEEIGRSADLVSLRNDRPRLYSAGGPTFYLDRGPPARIGAGGTPRLPPQPHNLVTSRLGVQLLQSGQPVPIELSDDDVHVAHLSRSPLVMLMPRSMTAKVDAGDFALQITISDDPRLLRVAQAETRAGRIQAAQRLIDPDFARDTPIDPLFQPGTGLADYEHGSGALCATRIDSLPWVHNFAVEGRFNVDQDGRRGIYVSTIIADDEAAGRTRNLFAEANELYLVWRTYRLGDFQLDVPSEPQVSECVRLIFGDAG